MFEEVRQLNTKRISNIIKVSITCTLFETPPAGVGKEAQRIRTPGRGLTATGED